MLNRRHKLALYMEGSLKEPSGKMGFGVLRYSPNPIICVIDSQFAGEDSSDVTGIARRCPVVSDVDEAHRLGAEVLVLGIAPSGGLIPEAWFPAIDRAIELGLSVVNGLHDLLAPRYPGLAGDQFVWDIRIEPKGIGVATGAARLLTNCRLLMIGTDMAVGKMTAGLEVYAAAQRRGVKAAFVATGQIGITIMGEGLPLDAVRIDYACGAVECEVMRHQAAELIVVEGQGALVHPGSSANLPLLRGACPTHFILCCRAGQDHLLRVPWVAIPNLADYSKLYEDLAEACGTFPRPKTVGVAINGAHVSDEEYRFFRNRIVEETGLPAVDVFREGADVLVEALLIG